MFHEQLNIYLRNDELYAINGVKFDHDNGVVQMAGSSQAVLSLAVLRETRCEHLELQF